MLTAWCKVVVHLHCFWSLEKESTKNMVRTKPET